MTPEAERMTQPVGRRHRKTGRKPLKVPRYQKSVYMTDQTLLAVKAWMREGRKDRSSFSMADAIEQMAELASFYYSERNAAQRLQHLTVVLGNMSAWKDIPWIRIEPNSGRVMRCTRCRKEERIEARRFSGLLRAITMFVEQHSDCKPRKNSNET
jgi:hypothetical protein